MWPIDDISVFAVNIIREAENVRDDDEDAAAALISVAFKIPHLSLLVQVA